MYGRAITAALLSALLAAPIEDVAAEYDGLAKFHQELGKTPAG